MFCSSHQPLVALDKVDLCYPVSSFSRPSFFDLFKKTAATDEIQALKNITLNIHEGERVALIGHNGAGKSTFLKMLAGIYPTSCGTITVNGGIRSMFEISLGFEPDATGRENIFYRSLLMGISPKDARATEREIVAFADLGEFIDYPIKAYSTGMLVRLAFAITTSYSGDILLIDEVIGAGDASFIEKAQTRLNNLIIQSKTVILASHDEHMLRQICTRGLVFEHGQIVCDSDINNALSYYSQFRS